MATTSFDFKMSARFAGLRFNGHLTTWQEIALHVECCVQDMLWGVKHRPRSLLRKLMPRTATCTGRAAEFSPITLSRMFEKACVGLRRIQRQLNRPL
jgi:hypothetical protein